MSSAKDIEVHPISKQAADAVVKRFHYSGKVDPRSQLHFGVFYRGSCYGAMQFGPSIDKAKTIRLVRDTPWNGFLELNRLAFGEMLPKNSESRALGYVFRLMKKKYPHLKWVVSFADATQCGDGAIYRACGFVLTQIKENRSMWRMPGGEVVCQLSLTIGRSTTLRRRYGMQPTETFGRFAKRVGAECLPGYQLRYLKFLDDSYRSRLSVPVIPFSEIAARGVGMYRGFRRDGVSISTGADQASGDGVTPISLLQSISPPEQSQP